MTKRDYAIERPISNNIKQLIIEAEHVISQLDVHLSAQKLKQILHNNRQNPLHKRQQHIAKRIRQKLKHNNLTLIQADKGKTVVITDKNELRHKSTIS